MCHIFDKSEVSTEVFFSCRKRLLFTGHSRGKQANGRREPDGPPFKKEEQILMQVAVSDTKD